MGKALFSKIRDFAIQNRLVRDNSLTALSLFCGAGGLDIGAYLASNETCKIDVQVAMDCWEDACNSLKQYAPIDTNVQQVDISSVEDPLKFWLKNSRTGESPDIVFGGPPCQAFSQAGKQKALDDERGVLVFQFIRFIEKLRPKFFIMENVANLQSIDRGKLYHNILNLMAALGYNVTSGVLCAADYGAPQLRKRMIFMGCRSDIGVLHLPEPTHTASPSLLGLPLYNTVDDAFKGLPALD